MSESVPPAPPPPPTAVNVVEPATRTEFAPLSPGAIVVMVPVIEPKPP